jgi:hypothetical protein
MMALGINWKNKGKGWLVGLCVCKAKLISFWNSLILKIKAKMTFGTYYCHPSVQPKLLD